MLSSVYHKTVNMSEMVKIPSGLHQLLLAMGSNDHKGAGVIQEQFSHFQQCTRGILKVNKQTNMLWYWPFLSVAPRELFRSWKHQPYDCMACARWPSKNPNKIIRVRSEPKYDWSSRFSNTSSSMLYTYISSVTQVGISNDSPGNLGCTILRSLKLNSESERITRTEDPKFLLNIPLEQTMQIF